MENYKIQKQHKICLEKIKEYYMHNDNMLYFTSDNTTIECMNCNKCGEYIFSDLFYYKSLGFNVNNFYIPPKFKKIHCQCKEIDRKKINIWNEVYQNPLRNDKTKNKERLNYDDTCQENEFCYNCKSFECQECLYNTDNEEDNFDLFDYRFEDDSEEEEYDY